MADSEARRARGSEEVAAICGTVTEYPCSIIVANTEVLRIKLAGEPLQVSSRERRGSFDLGDPPRCVFLVGGARHRRVVPVFVHGAFCATVKVVRKQSARDWAFQVARETPGLPRGTASMYSVARSYGPPWLSDDLEAVLEPGGAQSGLTRSDIGSSTVCTLSRRRGSAVPTSEDEAEHTRWPDARKRGEYASGSSAEVDLETEGVSGWPLPVVRPYMRSGNVGGQPLPEEQWPRGSHASPDTVWYAVVGHLWSKRPGASGGSNTGPASSAWWSLSETTRAANGELRDSESSLSKLGRYARRVTIPTVAGTVQAHECRQPPCLTDKCTQQDTGTMTTSTVAASNDEGHAPHLSGVLCIMVNATGDVQDVIEPHHATYRIY
ncbi:uncharacterized protein B0H18DRAFT_1103975 [Fomitopsis serialis]|uniref:uncharacterized protein n=1 Tax=Fomitopsis serialis TaxID=139415 RepID=UPI0020083901|nr:uncharacterized protein B0H18DRAFT_1103975 [Neoantrodia serialis]KAH9927779.1 hypothetical protein B0H18DRAFT_1103975 [Neoantrodia serialis]